MQASTSLAERISLISVSSTARVSAEAEKLRRAGLDVVDFGVGEPDFPTPDNIKQAAIRALDENFTRYTAMPGVQELRQAVCDRHRLDFGSAYSVPECVVSVGGKHAIFNTTQALINQGDEVVIPIPYWVTYYDVVNYAGGKCNLVETSEAEGFSLTAAQVERAVTSKTRLIIVNSPCNPSGALVEREEFEKIAHLAKKRGVWLMTDECYCRFLYDSDPYSVAALPGMKETVIVAGSLSKTYAMTGWRIGYAAGPAQAIAAAVNLQSQSTSNPTSISQKAGVEALNGPQDTITTMVKEFAWRRDDIYQRLLAIPGVTTPKPGGAFYIFPNFSAYFDRLSPKPGQSHSQALAEYFLEEAQVAAVPGAEFGEDRCIRFSFATSRERIATGVERIKTALAKLGK